MSEKLDALRRLMKKHSVQAYLVPSSDPHQSEYVPEFWRRRAFLTGFSGSAGDALVTITGAGLWTDSRYYLRAERELRGTGFALFRWGSPGVPSWQDWAARNLKPGDCLGLDPRLITHRDYAKLEKELATKSIRLKPAAANLVDAIWRERPAAPGGPVAVLAEKYAGESVARKLGRLRQKMAAEGADAHVLSQLDAIAWLFNIRGSDVPFNPVAIAYAIVTLKKALLFLATEKISPEVRAILKKEVRFRAYSDFPSALRSLAATRQRVWLDEAGASQWVVSRLARAVLLFKPSPVILAKAVKNASEIKGSKLAHRRDGAAMVRYLYWLQKAVPKGGVTELSAARKLEEIRKRQPLFQGLSFQTISSYGIHGAEVHYAVTPETDIPLKPEGTYLIDSGSQYLDATTDVTRTVCLGRPTAEQKDRFTRVLKGVISLIRTSFPKGTSGPQLDVLARRALWEKGLNYGHGTGHGIGAFLNVHEGPQSIAPARGFGIGLEPGMILSIEPGYYKEGEYGLRIENLALVVRDPGRTSQTSTFYMFETLTLCPIELQLVKKDLLTEAEVNWLNAYHRRVRRELTPLLEKDEAAWLKKATRPIVGCSGEEGV
jgi:Xaa-Pro aminopeptidase